MTLPRPQSGAQLRLLQTTWELFRGVGRWPNFEDVDDELDRVWGLDGLAIANEMPQDLLVPTVHGAVAPASEMKLTIAGIAACDDTETVIDLFLLSIRCATFVYSKPRPRGGPRPTLRAADVREHLMDERRVVPSWLDAMGQILVVGSSWWRSAAPDGPEWRFELDRGIRRYRGISTLSDYWTALEVSRGGAVPHLAPSGEDVWMETTSGERDDRLFLSHASADVELGDLLETTLRLGGVPRDRLFYSSARSTGVPAGSDVSATLRTRLQTAGLVVELITETFLQRPMCLMELGGAWALGLPTFPIVVPPMTVARAKAAIGDVHMATLGSDAQITMLFEELADRLGRDLGLHVNAADWNPAVRSMIKQLPSVLAGLTPSDTQKNLTSSEEGRPVPSASTSHETKLSAGQRNALGKAGEYLRSLAFSQTGLTNQLISEGFSAADAKYATTNVGADWTEQAAKKAGDYMRFGTFSQKGLVDQLVAEGFTQDEAESGASQAYQ